MKKVLFVATITKHITTFHLPYLKMFKEHGYEIYDWGNIASFDNPNQIDKFKMSFGGEIKTVYSCFIGNTLKGKILIKLRELKNKSKK